MCVVLQRIAHKTFLIATVAQFQPFHCVRRRIPLHKYIHTHYMYCILLNRLIVQHRALAAVTNVRRVCCWCVHLKFLHEIFTLPIGLKQINAVKQFVKIITVIDTNSISEYGIHFVFGYSCGSIMNTLNFNIWIQYVVTKSRR